MQIRCTNCGGNVPVGQSTNEVICEYCDAQLIVGRQKGIPHLIMSPYLKPNDAVLQLRRYLSTHEINTAARVLENNLVYLPYWHLIFKARGRTEEWIAAYSPRPEALLTISPVTGETDKKTPDDIPSATMVETDVLLENALLLSPYLTQELDRDKPAILVHVPFVKITYQICGENFEAYVDLVAGNIFADTIPASPEKQKSRSLALVAVTSLLLVTTTVAFLPWQVLCVVLPCVLFGQYTVIMKILSKMGW